ncbi:MAG: hypothetical protein AB1498_02595 [bacterium]
MLTSKAIIFWKKHIYPKKMFKRLFLCFSLPAILFFLLVSDSLAEGIKIYSSINNNEWIVADAIYPLKGDIIKLKVEKIENANIKWYQIVTDLFKTYKNANRPWENDPYKWIGFSKIDYQRKELTQFRNKWEIIPYENLNYNEDKFINNPIYNNNTGSFWFQAEIEKNGIKYKTPGIEDSDNYGLSPKVFRISIREKDSYLGYLTTFLNVPGLFGSIPYQSNNYIGVDCADVLMVSYGKWKNKRIDRDYNIGMIMNEFKTVVKFKINEGKPSVNLKWGKDIIPGDFIAVKYFGGKQYQHIGALYSDENKNGVLDEDDIIIHAGPYPLHKSYLNETNFDGDVVVIRHD